MIVDQAEGHELIELDLVILISLQQLRAGIGKAQALFDDGGPMLKAAAIVSSPSPSTAGSDAKALTGRVMQRLALRVLSKTVGLDKTFAADDAGNRRVPGAVSSSSPAVRSARDACRSGWTPKRPISSPLFVQDRTTLSHPEKAASAISRRRGSHRNAGINLADIGLIDV